MLKIKILMKQMEERQIKVEKDLRTLRNITDFGKLKGALDVLECQGIITELEYKRLTVANHALQSYVNAF